MDEINFLKNFPVLLAATKEDGEPIPGYLLAEITVLASQTTDNLVTQIIDFLIYRLHSGSSQVKLKALKILHYLVRNGSPNITEQLRLKDGEIKKAADTLVPLGNYQGQTPQSQVSKATKELLEAMFQPPVPPVVPAGTLFPGYGSSSKEGTGFGTSSAPSSSTVGDKMMSGLNRMMDCLLTAPTQPPHFTPLPPSSFPPASSGSLSWLADSSSLLTETVLQFRQDPESQLVEEIVKSQDFPSSFSQIQEVRNKAADLDRPRVVQLLASKLSPEASQEQLNQRILVFLEALLHLYIPQLGALLEPLESSLQPLLTSMCPVLAMKAKKVKLIANKLTEALPSTA